MNKLKILLQKNKMTVLLFGGALLGALLLLYGGGENKEAENTYNTANEEYLAAVENKIEQTVKRICGGEAEVIVTADCGDEYIYAKNTSKKTSDGGEEVSVQYATSSRSDEEALLLTVVCPRIRGIAVVCDGGDNPVLQNKIISLLSCAYGISGARVYVAGANQQS